MTRAFEALLHCRYISMVTLTARRLPALFPDSQRIVHVREWTCPISKAHTPNPIA
jgi:hypothetical protein